MISSPTDMVCIHVCSCGCCRQQKDVALVSLSNILHQVRYSNEAVIVILAAIDISHKLNVNYFMLGNIYAVWHVSVSVDCVVLVMNLQ